MSDLKSLEELQLLIKEEEKRLSSSSTEKHASTNNKVVHQFVEALKISSGQKRLPTYIIYYNYIVWCRANYKKIHGNTEFFRTFKKYCEQYRHGKQRFYLVNDDSNLNLSEEFNEKAKEIKKRTKRVSSPKPKDESPL